MEVELRAKIRNPENIVQRLSRLGAIKLGEEKLTDYYFGSINLYKKIGHSFWIRLRVKKDKIELAYKGSTGKDGVYEEYEQELQDIDTAISIFSGMGLTNEITVKKKRQSFKLGHISIEIDNFKGKGTFIEVEMTSKSPKKTSLYGLFKSLEIPKQDIFEKGYITLMLEEKKSTFTRWIKN